jgi:hypothetical protein
MDKVQRIYISNTAPSSKTFQDEGTMLNGCIATAVILQTAHNTFSQMKRIQ